MPKPLPLIVGDFGSINGSPPVPCRCVGSFAIYGICQNSRCQAIWTAMMRKAVNEAAEEAVLSANTKAGRLARRKAKMKAEKTANEK